MAKEKKGAKVEKTEATGKRGRKPDPNMGKYETYARDKFSAKGKTRSEAVAALMDKFDLTKSKATKVVYGMTSKADKWTETPRGRKPGSVVKSKVAKPVSEKPVKKAEKKAVEKAPKKKEEKKTKPVDDDDEDDVPTDGDDGDGDDFDFT